MAETANYNAPDVVGRYRGRALLAGLVLLVL